MQQSPWQCNNLIPSQTPQVLTHSTGPAQGDVITMFWAILGRYDFEHTHKISKEQKLHMWLRDTAIPIAQSTAHNVGVDEPTQSEQSFKYLGPFVLIGRALRTPTSADSTQRSPVHSKEKAVGCFSS